MTGGVLSDLSGFMERQNRLWPKAAEAYAALDNARRRVISSSGLALQFNPARMVSTAARTDSSSIGGRRCFLCAGNRPEQQISADLGDGFELLVNPFPILHEHFTVASCTHQRQELLNCCDKMLEIAAALPQEYIVFYNGPRSGASAPDHLHLQIGRADGIPLIDKVRNNRLQDDEVYSIEPFGFRIFVLRHANAESFRSFYSTLTVLDGEYEPRLNVLAMNIDGETVCLFIPRGRHRPDCYYADDGARRLVSPGAIDMAGLVITPREEDFNAMSERDILSVYHEVTPCEPMISVGIMQSAAISFSLDTPYTDGVTTCLGEMRAACSDGKIEWRGELLDRLTLKPLDGEGRFTLKDVTIGREFHWERQEEQSFAGELEFVIDGNSLWAVNRLPVEEYLNSVISSEMNPSAPLEFLKAHAVISRSWVLAQISASRRKGTAGECHCKDSSASVCEEPDRIIRWYDHSQHTLFDVCADDHCQRYQGLTRIENANALRAVRETRAETIVYEGHLCDARFSKCCGGISEQFETCWQDSHSDYLIPVRDASFSDTSIPDLSLETAAEQWIRSTPQSFCSHPSPALLAQVLNSYDRETEGFYRWKVRYDAVELSELFARKSGLEIGRITALKPLRRGPSGRIFELQVCGTERTVTIGKELEIRRVLSESHLYSSAFVVDTETDAEGNATAFTLTGAGWGHGVGLCQIGAAVMGSKGYSYRKILSHYYPGTRLGKFY